MDNNEQYEISADFDRLVNSPDGAKVMAKFLAEERAKMNTMTLAEFRQYEPLFQLDGMTSIGVEPYKDLATKYYHTISIYDPLRIVDGSTVVMTLPPIFDRFNPIMSAGKTGVDINQAFINACMSDDPMIVKKMGQYAQFYKQMIDVTNDSKKHQAKEKEAGIQKDEALNSMKTMRIKHQESVEIEDITPSNFKDTGIESLSETCNNSLLDGEEDGFEPL